MRFYYSETEIKSIDDSQIQKVEDFKYVRSWIRYSGKRSENRRIGGACGAMVMVVGNGHGNTNSNPGRV